MSKLWQNTSPGVWQDALESYEAVIEKQGVNRLPELDRWYREELPAAIAGRSRPHVALDELARITEWKMKRGVWRARNLALVRKNEPELVVDVSAEAFGEAPDPVGPIRTLAKLGGVGPATASAVAAAAVPAIYPFLDDLAAEQVDGLGEVKYTLTYYREYAEALRGKARELGEGWTAAAVERALWAGSGGKAGVG